MFEATVVSAQCGLPHTFLTATPRIGTGLSPPGEEETRQLADLQPLTKAGTDLNSYTSIK